MTLCTSRHAAGDRLASHRHPRPYVAVVLEGSYFESSGGESRRCARGTAVFHPEGHVHADRFRSDTVCLNVELTSDFLRRVLSRDSEPPSGPVYGSVSEWTLDTLAEARATHTDLSAGVVGDVGAMVLAELCGEGYHARCPAWVRQARTAIHEARGRISMHEVARLVGIHPVHLSRSFRRFTGWGAAEYAASVRLERARRALLRTDDSCGAIAFECGFSDQSHFTRVFRDRYASTPMAYRRQARGLPPG